MGVSTSLAGSVREVIKKTPLRAIISVGRARLGNRLYRAPQSIDQSRLGGRAWGNLVEFLG